MLTTLTTFFKTANFYPIKRSELFSSTDLIASCGGLMGLFMGFSLLSLVEMIYYCAIRPWLVCRRRRYCLNDRIIYNNQSNNEPKSDSTIEKWRRIKLMQTPTYLKIIY